MFFLRTHFCLQGMFHVTLLETHRRVKSTGPHPHHWHFAFPIMFRSAIRGTSKPGRFLGRAVQVRAVPLWPSFRPLPVSNIPPALPPRPPPPPALLHFALCSPCEGMHAERTTGSKGWSVEGSAHAGHLITTFTGRIYSPPWVFIARCYTASLTSYISANWYAFPPHTPAPSPWTHRLSPRLSSDIWTAAATRGLTSALSREESRYSLSCCF